MPTYKLTPRDRVERAAARVVARLSPRTLRRLAGKPIVIDGQTLDPQIQLILKAMASQGLEPWSKLGLEATREEVRRIAMVNSLPIPKVKAVTDFTIPGAAGPLAARRYDAARFTDGALPALVYYHGGGFVFGDIDTHDELCRMLCFHSGVTVISVEYRLAPECPFPAAVDDCIATFGWVNEHAGELGLDPARIAVGGDSAGGNLSAVVSQQAVLNDTPSPAFQLLIYPATNRDIVTRSEELFGEGFFLVKEDMVWFTASYAGVVGDIRAAPLCAEDLRGVAPAYITTAGFDPLRDEGEAYAAKLIAAGVPTALRRHEGLIHGFANMTAVSRTARDAVVEMSGALRMGLAAKTPAAVAANA